MVYERFTTSSEALLDLRIGNDLFSFPTNISMLELETLLSRNYSNVKVSTIGSELFQTFFIEYPAIYGNIMDGTVMISAGSGRVNSYVRSQGGRSEVQELTFINNDQYVQLGLSTEFSRKSIRKFLWNF